MLLPSLVRLGMSCREIAVPCFAGMTLTIWRSRHGLDEKATGCRPSSPNHGNDVRAPETRA